MIHWFRARSRLWAVAGLWTGVLLTGFNVYAAVVTYVPQFLVRNDFRLAYGAALNAIGADPANPTPATPQTGSSTGDTSATTGATDTTGSAPGGQAPEPAI